MSDFKVIIIGSGMSGLSAAIKLIENGINDILILEANDRLGGRICTIPFDNHFIEMGAEWIHGTRSNPIYELSKSLNLLDKNHYDNNRSVYYVTQDGVEQDEEFVDKTFEKIEHIFDSLEDIIENELDDDSNQSLGELLDDNFKKMLGKYKNINDIELVKAIYKNRINEERCDNSSDNLNLLSAIGWNEYEDFEGNPFAKLKYGYSKLIEFFFKNLPKDSILLNHVVQCVDWSSVSKLKLSVYDSINKKNKTFSADFVLCTTSLGYLKKHCTEMFAPILPQNKIIAIDRLGFGCVNKVMTVFDKPILDKNFEGLKIFWRDDVEFQLKNSLKKWNLDNHTFYKSLDNFEMIPNLPHVLLTFVCGNDATFIESLSEECLLDVIHELFSKCFPRLALPKPKCIIKSSWSSDPFFLGSYSYVKVGSHISDLKALAQPLNQKVFFAGEGTSIKHIGTVHGAYISGREAANKITKEIKNS